MPTCTILLESFTMVASEELITILFVVNKTTCYFEPFISKLLIITIIYTIINLCLSTSVFNFSLSHFL